MRMYGMHAINQKSEFLALHDLGDFMFERDTGLPIFILFPEHRTQEILYKNVLLNASQIKLEQKTFF